MKLNKSAYLFAAALVAGTMGMTSCSSEIDDLTSQWEGKTTDATIGFSVNGLPGTRSTAADVNLDGDQTVATINNVAVIPMIGETPTTSIKFGAITNDKTTADNNKVQRSLQSTVNRFLVYGNMPDGIYSKLSETATPNLDDIKFELTTNGSLNIGGSSENVYAPHGLYYYRDTEVAAPGTDKKAGYFKSDNNWDQVSGAWTLTTSAIEAAKSIKIQDVRYAVGVLATAVFQNDGTNKVFYAADDATSYTFESYQTAKSSAPVTVTGIVIYDQYKTLKYDFTAEDASDNKVTVYENTTNGTIGKDTDPHLEKNANTDIANIYTVVAPTAAGKGIGISIEFTVAADAKMVTTAGEFASNSKFYMQATLSPQPSDASVFSAATSTMLNATVTDWGKATVNPEKPTDANVGIEFDASWIQGVVYDINI